MFALLASISFLTALLAWLFPRLDTPLAWLLAATLALLAGTRSGGHDYEEYITIIDAVRWAGEVGWVEQLYFAKDPLLLLIIDAAELISSDYRIVFLIVALLSVGTKLAATRPLHGRRTVFLAAYAVFLAPALEFAAIRAGLALGFLGLALAATPRWRFAWSFAAVMSHASMLVAWFGQLPGTQRKLALLLAGLSVPAALPLLLEVVQDDPRYVYYADNFGTVNALLLPVLTTLTLVALRAELAGLRVRAGVLGPAASAACAVCVGAALVLALPAVTVSTRLMEVGWFIMLTQAAAAASGGARASVRLVAISAALLIILTLANLFRVTWAVMLPLNP